MKTGGEKWKLVISEQRKLAQDGLAAGRVGAIRPCWVVVLQGLASALLKGRRSEMPHLTILRSRIIEYPCFIRRLQLALLCIWLFLLRCYEYICP